MELFSILVQIGLFCALVSLVYAIICVIDVVNEERERLVWNRRMREEGYAVDEDQEEGRRHDAC